MSNKTAVDGYLYSFGKGIQLRNRYIVLNFEYTDKKRIDRFENDLKECKMLIRHNPYDPLDCTKERKLNRIITFEDFIRHYASIRIKSNVNSDDEDNEQHEGGEQIT